ncbi:hypothetical protein [Evansella clarkii]|uniref:hypothetical protein n=1 Tax=Evansella clarkii TaxID=79879 RepID=UPI001C46018B|nr:hypothetical protein [Evansella clarkii]
MRTAGTIRASKPDKNSCCKKIQLDFWMTEDDITSEKHPGLMMTTMKGENDGDE